MWSIDLTTNPLPAFLDIWQQFVNGLPKESNAILTNGTVHSTNTMQTNAISFNKRKGRHEKQHDWCLFWDRQNEGWGTDFLSTALMICASSNGNGYDDISWNRFAPIRLGVFKNREQQIPFLAD